MAKVKFRYKIPTDKQKTIAYLEICQLLVSQLELLFSLIFHWNPITMLSFSLNILIEQSLNIVINIFVIIQMRLQNQKQTPQKIGSRPNKNRILEETLNKQLLCPFMETFCVGSFHFNQTPMRKQPQYLLTPSPVKKDLFSQLLGTQTKHLSPTQQNELIIEQQDNGMHDVSSSESESMDEQQSFQNEGNWSQQNGIKKRKRKSTAQIKLLKLELDGQMNWTKQKIVKMAQVTGLSQSQVYKWCWDQKKKQNKHRIQQSRSLMMDRRKFIKKSIGYRQQISKFDKQGKLNELKQKQNIKQVSRRTTTHLKPDMNFIDDDEQTQKKVNKKLLFF